MRCVDIGFVIKNMNMGIVESHVWDDGVFCKNRVAKRQCNEKEKD
jgi:hypothetical protein